MAPGVLELRIEALLDLAGEERHQHQHQHQHVDPLPPQQQPPAPAGGHHPQQRQRDQQHQPHVARRARLVVRQPERAERQHRRPPPPQPQHRQREDQQQKQIQQRPRGQPVAVDAVGAEQREQAPAGRQVQGDLEVVGVGLPAGGRDRAGARHAPGGLEVDRARPDLDAGRTGGRVGGDQLPLAAGAHRAELLPGGGVEPPDPLHRAADVVAEAQRPAALVEPQLTLDLQAGGLLEPHPAHPLVEPERLAGVPLIDGQLAPLVGERRLRDVDRGDSRDLDEAELGAGLEGDQLLLHRRLRTRGVGDLRRVVGPERGDVDEPLAGPHLGLEVAGLVDRHRHRAFDGGEFPSGGQDHPELLLAALAGDDQLNVGVEP